MAYLTVTTQLDVVAPGDGQLSLREAIEMANATSEPDTIRFVATLAGQRLVLTGGQLAISQDVTITGDSGNNGDHVTIDAGGRSRVLSIGGGGVDADLQELVITGGNNSGIYLGQGSRLSIADSTISQNFASYRAGGIFVGQGSRLSIADSTISQNFTYGKGAGIYASPGSEVRIVRSKLSENLGNGFYSCLGGAIAISSGSLHVEASTIVGNDAFSGGGIFTQGSQVEIINSTLADNQTAGRYNYGLGGGLSARSSWGGSRRLRAWRWRDQCFVG